MMKKALYILGLVGFIAVVGLAGEWETHYTRPATCTNVIYETHVVEFTDVSGHVWEWEFEPFETYKVGDAYNLHMSDNHSTTISDDFIRNIEKRG